MNDKWRMRSSPLVLLAATIGMVALACGGGGSDYETSGDALRAIATAYCDRAIECGVGPESERDLCESAFVNAACEQTNCNAEFQGRSESVDDCIDAYDDYNCAGIETTIPAECRSF
jgi:hypothetical protein